MFLLAHHDHPAALDGHPVDEHLVARVDVIGERFEPPLALGAQFVLVVAGDQASLAHRIDDVAGLDPGPVRAAERATCAGEICAAVCFTFLVA